MFFFYLLAIVKYILEYWFQVESGKILINYFKYVILNDKY